MKRVLCIAESCCDLVFGGLPQLPALGEEIYGTHFSMQAGGGANTPQLLGRLGVPTAFWTLLGDDLAGRIVLDALRKSHVQVIPHGGKALRTPVTAVLSTPDDRAFASYAGEGDALIGDLDALEAAIRDADIVHTYLGYCLSYPIAALCKKHGRLLSLDCSFSDVPNERTRSILSQCDLLKLNEGEAMRLSGSSDADTALNALSAQTRGAVIVTRGQKGSIGKEKGKPPIEQAAIVCGTFVDACGAGDAFTAGLLYGMAEKRPFSECLRRGALLAGQCVTWYGGCSETFDGTLE